MALFYRRSNGAIKVNHGTTLINAKKDPFTSIQRPAYRRSLRTSRSFSPLTPILASPHCGSSADFVSDEETEQCGADSAQEPSADPAAPGLDQSGKSLPPIPAWTSTPPTPPRTQEHSSPRQNSSQTVSPSVLYPKPALSSRSRLIPKQRRASAPPTSFSKFSDLNMPLGPPSTLSMAFTAGPLHMAADSLSLIGASVSFAKPHNLRPPSPYPRAVFHIPQDPEDNEEESSKEVPAEPSPPVEPREHHDPEAAKDYVRRYHALMELLTTEIGYLIDLRVLVTVSNETRFPWANPTQFALDLS
jgi:hypothetical protein